MKTPDQYRAEAQAFCQTALSPLCAEVLHWTDTGFLHEAPFFSKLTELCNMYAGLATGRKIAENMVRTQAMRYVVANP